MSNLITLHVSGLTGQIDLELPEGDNLGAAREAGNIPEGVGFAAGGQRVDDSYVPRNGERVSTLPPEVKAGR